MNVSSLLARLSVMTVAALAAVGCATPGPLVSLEPRSANVVWVAGRAVVTKQQQGVRVATAFEHQDGPMLALRLEVENLTSAPLDVNPSAFVFVPCATSGTESCGDAATVIDPEEAIHALDEGESRERADAANQQAFNTSLVLLSAVGDVASVASPHPHPTTGLGTLAIAEQGEADQARAQASIGSMAERRAVWSNVAFRRNTIEPGHGATGLVYLPIADKAQYLWVSYPIGSERFTFEFKQDVERLRPRTASAGEPRE